MKQNLAAVGSELNSAGGIGSGVIYDQSKYDRSAEFHVKESGNNKFSSRKTYRHPNRMS